MVGMAIFALFMTWFILTEGNIFMRDDDDDWDSTHQSID
jgi:hypothetical protein